MIRTRFALVAAPALLAGIALGGCSSSSEEAADDTANANAAVCASLTALRGQISEVTDSAAAAADSGDSVTVGQAQTAVEAIQSAWALVSENLGQLSDATKKQFEMAQEDYQTSLENVNPDDSLATARDQVAGAQEELRSSYDDIVSQLGC